MISKPQNKLLPDPPDVLNKQSRLYRRIEFEFLRKIGDGAYGQVWKVRHKKSNIFFALKQVPKAKVFKILPQFNREVSILYELSHPHIIKLLTHFEDDKCFYLIMELIEGGTLFHKLYREKNLLEPTAAQCFREVVLAIEYLHSRTPPIVHRDIKPENILIDNEGRMKLIDFGWANYCEVAGTVRKTYCGTSEYMPPEIIETKGHGTSADIWCLGILLYEMLVGSTPFKSQSNEKMAQVIKEASISFPPSISSLAKDLIASMLEKDSNRRIDIFQIKEHIWLKQHLPIRSTLQQYYQPSKLIKTIQLEPEDKKEHTTAATNSSESEEESEYTFGEMPSTRSLENLKAKLADESSEISLNKIRLQDAVRSFDMEEEKIGGIEKEILQKRKEILRLGYSTKELLLRLFDINFELQILQEEDNYELNEKIKHSQKNLLELGKVCKVYQLKLESLKRRVIKESGNIIKGEMQLDMLQKNLKNICGMDKHIKTDSKSNENELKLNIDLLKQQIDEKTHTLTCFSSEELRRAKDISNTIKENMDNFVSHSRDIKKKIDDTEEKSIEFEQSIKELTISYEKEKSNIFHRFQATKIEVLYKQKVIKENASYFRKKTNEDAVKKLKNEINQVFNLDTTMKHTDIYIKNDRIRALRSMISRLEKIEVRKRKDLVQMRELIVVNQEIINCKLFSP